MQVCIGTTDDIDLIRRFIDGRDGKYPYQPKEGLLFPELLQPEPPAIRPTPEPGASCAALVAALPDSTVDLLRAERAWWVMRSGN